MEVFTKKRVAQGYVLTDKRKLSSKSVHQFVQLQTFNRCGFQQIQLDIHFLKIALRDIADDEAPVDFLLDEDNDHMMIVTENMSRSIPIQPYYRFLKRHPLEVCINYPYSQPPFQVISMQLPKKKLKSRLITISPSDGRWHGKWNCNYTFSLRQLLHQQNVPDDVDKDAEVSITLCIQKHAGLGMSVEGRMKTCFTRECCNCFTPYLRQIDAPFKVWILPSRNSCKQSDDDHQLLPDIGGDDPSVIYVKPGCEADLDSLIQETIYLTTSIRETCSEACENSEPKLHYLGTQNKASIDKRWCKLLELKNNIS